MAIPGSAVRHLALVLTAAGLLVLPACGGSRAIDLPERSPAPASPSASVAPAPSAADRRRDCNDLDSRDRLHVLQFARALGAKPASGVLYRAGVAQVYIQFAQSLELTSLTTVDAQLGAAVWRWADANREIAEYVRTTEPSGDNVLELGPGHDRDKAARAEVGVLCGRPF